MAPEQAARASRRSSLTATADDEEVLQELLKRGKSFMDIAVVGADKELQIVKYDHAQLADMCTMFQPWSRGAIFRRWRIWWQIFAYILLAAGVATLFVIFSAAPAKINPDALSKVSDYFNMFLPFLFGIYLNTIFTRWWEMRTNGVGGINNSLNSMCMILAVNVRGTECTDTKKLLLRYGLLAHELVYRAARSTDDELQDLVDAGVLMAEESQIIESLPRGAHRPQAIWVWIVLIWDGLLREKKVPWHAHQVVLGQINAGRAATKSVFTHLETQIPFAYVHLMACLVHFNLSILALQAGLVIAKAIGTIKKAGQLAVGEEHAADTEAITNLVAQILKLTMVPMLYLGFLTLSQEIADPFGTDLNDFPRAQYHNMMQDECESFYHMAESVPPELMPFLLPDEADPGAPQGCYPEGTDMKRGDYAPSLFHPA
uniref:Bestrophin homolog n=1 Tax=Alexandrium catenella TaxID=2925 RepID=A0A7S1RW34_ALECA|mmetsp:Transcript_75591/g.200784  ORF Transcript_75591/g.200784 Transcript_75591/m.200784 type:complete len:430 (+) Transcript_75591:56-1345(+)